jgi:hypothetical protein
MSKLRHISCDTGKTFRTSPVLQAFISSAENGKISNDSLLYTVRRSGLTGACINAMLFNNFIRQAIDGTPFCDRYSSYSSQTHWSNLEVVHRGTGSNFARDGFLRPGFSYDGFIDWLYSRVVEHQESGQDPTTVLTHDWKAKIAASLIPRGMEINKDYTLALRLHLRYSIFNKVFGEVDEKWKIGRDSLDWTLLQARKKKKKGGKEDLMNWGGILKEINISPESKKELLSHHIPLAKQLEKTCNKVIDHASSAYVYNGRISSELFNQPKAVGSLFDDFAVEAQVSLVMRSSFWF